MITLIVIYAFFYIICAWIMCECLIGEQTSYPDYKKAETTFWTYVWIYNPLNVIIGIGFTIWIIYSVFKKNKPEEDESKSDISVLMRSHREYMKNGPHYEMTGIKYADPIDKTKITKVDRTEIKCMNNDEYIEAQLYLFARGYYLLNDTQEYSANGKNCFVTFPSTISIKSNEKYIHFGGFFPEMDDKYFDYTDSYYDWKNYKVLERKDKLNKLNELNDI